MCLDCGCVLDGTGQPGDDHGDPAHITLADLAAAALASGIAPGQAAANIASTFRGLADDTLSAEIAKAQAEQRYVLGVAYQPGKDDRIAKGVDGGRDFFTDAELEQAAWRFLADGPQVGLYHVDGTLGAATVVESYIYRGPDWVLKGVDGSELVVKSGYWMLGAILDDRAWQMYKAGKITGWSPQGIAKRRRIVPAS
jgi:Putative phage serine protease XkdF